MINFIYPALGGLLIGFSALILMTGLGRIAGISGTLWQAIRRPKQNIWRILFLMGLVCGTALVHIFLKIEIPNATNASFSLSIIAGLLVGFGTKLGSGCTSGHGVCGIGRLSMRSIFATISFMLSGILTVSLIRHVINPGALV